MKPARSNMIGDWLRWGLCLALAPSVLSCGGSYGGPGPQPGDPTNCQLAAISNPTTATPPCPAIAAGCPRQRPSSARTLLQVSSCSFGENSTSCTPVVNPFCPTSNIVYTATLVNPNVGAGDPCVADLRVQVSGTATGGATVEWRAQEFRRSGTGCEATGSELSGQGTVTGPCCQTQIDIVFPTLRFTHRLVVRTDWQ